MKVIINRYMKNTEITLKEAETSVGQEIFWTIPNDYRTTMSAINQGKSLSQCSAKASITRNIHELADSLVNHRVKEEKKGWRFLKRR
jgi:pilus assembly protein CpaE